MTVEHGQLARFESLFTGLRRAYGYSRVGRRRNAEGKVQAHNKTIVGELTSERYRKHLEGTESLGVVPIDDGNVCRFAAIDIDEYQGLDHGAIVRKLSEKSVPMTVCKSKSGGAHVYAFFTEPQNAYNVRTMLMRIAVVLGQPGVEIFPKQAELANDHDVGNWINMPYFGDTRPAVDEDGEPLTLEQFLSVAEERRISDLDVLSVTTPAAFDDGPPCLQQLAQNGIPSGARNNALMGFGVYAKKKYPDDWEDIVEEHNRRYMDSPLSSEEVINTVKSLKRKDYGYKCNDAPLVDVCNRELCLARRYGIQPGSNDNASVQIDGVTKINTDPPIWIVGVEGHRITVSTTELVDQGLFRKRVLEKTTRIMPRMKADNWDALLRSKLEEVEIEEAPDDASTAGQLMDYLERWLMDHPTGEQKSDLLLGKPILEDDGRICFRSNDFCDFLQRNRFTDMKKPDIWAALRDEKSIQHKQIRVQGRCIRVWIVTAPDVNEDLEPMNVSEREEF